MSVQLGDAGGPNGKPERCREHSPGLGVSRIWVNYMNKYKTSTSTEGDLSSFDKNAYISFTLMWAHTCVRPGMKGRQTGVCVAAGYSLMAASPWLTCFPPPPAETGPADRDTERSLVFAPLTAVWTSLLLLCPSPHPTSPVAALHPLLFSLCPPPPPAHHVLPVYRCWPHASALPAHLAIAIGSQLTSCWVPPLIDSLVGIERVATGQCCEATSL